MQVGHEKSRDFQPISCFISEMIQDSAILWSQTGNRMRSIEWCHSGCPWV